VSADWTLSGGDITWRLGFVSADSHGIDTVFGRYISGTITGKTVGRVTAVVVNPLGADVDAGFGHLTIENDVTDLFSASFQLVAYDAEYGIGLPNGRLFRLCTENNIPLFQFGTPDVLGELDQMGAQQVAPILDLLREVETADQGQLFDGKHAGLTYVSRRWKSTGSAHLTIDASLGRLTSDFQAVDDDQRDCNQASVTRSRGATRTYADTSGPKGTATIGIYDDSTTINTYKDSSLSSYARWFVLLGTVPGYRYPTVTVDITAAPSFAAPVLDMIPGGKITINNLDTTLAGFPDATVELMVEGIKHELTTRTWKVTFTCSPWAPWATGLDGANDDGGGGGGAGMADAESVAFTDSGGLAGEYHFYGDGLPASGAGLVVHLHGDGAYEYSNPTDNYCLAGNRGLVAVAKAKGYALLVPKAPDTTGTVTWWEAGARNATYLAELIDSLVTAHGLNRSKIWLSGYSGGSVFINAYFVPTYGKAKITGGGALMLGGGNAAASTPVGWDSTFKAAFPMYWVTGGQDDGTYAGDGYDALSAATAGKTYYAGQGFTTTQTTPPGIGHEIDGAFGPILDDVLPTLPGYSPPSRTPGTTRPTLVTSYLVTAAANDTSTLTTTSFTPSAGEVIIVKAFDADYGSPNISQVLGGGLTYATKIHIQATSKAEAWIFAAEVGATSPGAMTVSVSWFGTVGRHGIVVERWSSGLVKGVPAQGVTVMGSGAPSSSITPTNANSVLTWLDVDWNVVAGTATYRSSATQTQTASLTTVRAYAAYQNSPSTSAQTVGLTAPTGQAWSMGAIEILPAP
jgi:predicted esterase